MKITTLWTRWDGQQASPIQTSDLIKTEFPVFQSLLRESKTDEQLRWAAEYKELVVRQDQCMLNNLCRLYVAIMDEMRVSNWTAAIEVEHMMRLGMCDMFTQHIQHVNVSCGTKWHRSLMGIVAKIEYGYISSTKNRILFIANRPVL